MKGLSRAQSTLEYVIVVAVVIGAILIIAVALKGKLTSSYSSLGTSMETKVKEVKF